MIVAGGQALQRRGMGQMQFDAYGNPIWDTINRGIDVVGAWSSRSPYISPDDPRFQQNGIYYGAAGGYPGSPANVPAGFVPGTVNTQGFQLNWWSAALIGLLLGAFFLGKRR